MKRLLFFLAGFVLTSKRRGYIAKAAKRQEEILKIMTILTGNYRYEAIEAAINTSGMLPNDIYMALAANEHTFALARFYEVLTGN